jgi:hypothetical protein
MCRTVESRTVSQSLRILWRLTSGNRQPHRSACLWADGSAALFLPSAGNPGQVKRAAGPPPCDAALPKAHNG